MVQGLKSGEKEQLLAEQKTSGKSIAEFSRERGIDPQVLYEFRKRRSRSSVGFARVQTGVSIEIELGSGIRIHAPLESMNAVLRELSSK